MKYRAVLTGLAAAAFGLSLAGCQGKKTSTIKIDGSSTVFPVTEAVAEEFQKQHRARVTVGVSGTGGGFKKFTRGETDISDASRPISKSEMEAAREAGIEFVELPIAYDAITVAVHPDNDWVKELSVADLKKIWEPAAKGKITRWNQLNKGWPDKEIDLYGPGSDSGTFDYFTEAVVGKSGASRTDYTASEDDNTLVQGIAGNKYALGYLPFAYYEKSKGQIKAVPIKWEKNKVQEAVLPTMEHVKEGTYNPLSRPLFLYVNKQSVQRPEVKAFVEFYLTEGPDLIKEVGYLPLPEKAYEMGLERFREMKTGTAFGGEPEVGVSVEELLKRESKS